MNIFTRMTRRLPIFHTLREWALADKLRTIAHDHPRSEWFHHHYTAYKDDAICIMSWQINGHLFVCFPYHDETGGIPTPPYSSNRNFAPRYIPGDWENLIEPLYKEAIAEKDRKRVRAA